MSHGTRLTWAPKVLQAQLAPDASRVVPEMLWCLKRFLSTEGELLRHSACNCHVCDRSMTPFNFGWEKLLRWLSTNHYGKTKCTVAHNLYIMMTRQRKWKRCGHARTTKCSHRIETSAMQIAEDGIGTNQFLRLHHAT